MIELYENNFDEFSLILADAKAFLEDVDCSPQEGDVDCLSEKELGTNPIDLEEGFKIWLTFTGLKPHSQNAYRTALTNAENFCSNLGILSFKFYENHNLEEVQKKIKEILVYPQFMEKNRSTHNFMSAAMGKYKLYLESLQKNPQAVSEQTVSSPTVPELDQKNIVKPPVEKVRETSFPLEEQFKLYLSQSELKPPSQKLYLSGMRTLNKFCISQGIIEKNLYENTQIDVAKKEIQVILKNPKFQEKM